MANQSVKGKTDQFMEQFTQAAQGMFEVTSRYHTTYEQGIYGCVTARPSRRMRASLGVDREVLAIVSTFNDQQQRTIKFIQHEIDQSQGRFESSIAIVIHNDPDGNSKLKHWGREKGISVLPVSAERLAACEKVGSESSLEKILCAELYSHDPFDVTGPVSDDQNFFGRREEAIDLARKLQKGQIRACLGIRKVGKTSIINRVLREIKGSHDCVAVMVDCSRDEVWSMTASQLLVSMANAVGQAEKGYAAVSSVTASVGINQACDELLGYVVSGDRPLIFVFDEVDYISPGSPTALRWRTDFNVFWRNLRSIIQECSRRGRAVSILVSGVSSHWFSVESIDGVENAAVAFIPEEYLSPMPEGATVAMLRRLGSIAGLRFDEVSARIVARSTGNMPYWARKCCSYIHRQIPSTERPCNLSASRVQPLVEAFAVEEGVAIADVALRHLFRVHPQLRDAAFSCEDGKASDVPEVLKSALRRYGILGYGNKIEGVMMQRALSALRSSGRSDETNGQFESARRSEEENRGGLQEWAEELATLGSRRNVLERRLRNIVVNFVRFDYLKKGSQGVTVRERLLRGIAEERRGKLAHLSAEDAASRLTWHELTGVIATKEWVLFAEIFGDKKKFKDMCELVNDRFDAHAKDADLADVALYRRALTYLEEKVDKIG